MSSLAEVTEVLKTNMAKMTDNCQTFDESWGGSGVITILRSVLNDALKSAIFLSGSRTELPMELLNLEGFVDLDFMVHSLIVEARSEHDDPTNGRQQSAVGGSFNVGDLLLHVGSLVVDYMAGARLSYDTTTASVEYTTLGVHPGYVRMKSTENAQKQQTPEAASYLAELINSVQQWLERMTHGPAHGLSLDQFYNSILQRFKEGYEDGKTGVLDLASEFVVLHRKAFTEGSNHCWTDCDVVFCLKCQSWPSDAQSFVSRSRKTSNWPTRALILKVLQEGCHLVKVSHPKSTAPDKEYRLSFSVAESILVRSWTTCQKYCYHLLRILLKRNRLKGEEGLGVIRVYHLKTLMLWACERRAATWWSWTNIISCCSQLLMEMFDWLAQRRCPNYFIPDNNMFDHIPPGADLSREMQFVIGFADEPQLWRFIMAEEKLIWWPDIPISEEIKEFPSRFMDYWCRAASAMLYSFSSNFPAKSGTAMTLTLNVTERSSQAGNDRTSTTYRLYPASESDARRLVDTMRRAMDRNA